LHAPPVAKEAFSIVVVQGGLGRTAGEKVRRYLALTETAVAPDTRIVVWPEYALETHLQEPTPHRAAVLALGRRLGVDLVLGAPRYDVAASGVRYRNAAFLVRNGRVVAHDDKTLLLPFAERRMPWVSSAHAMYSPGTGHRPLPADGLSLGTFLCWESMHPHLIRGIAARSEVLVNLSNDDWFGHAAPARHQLDIARLRAVENRRWLVRATATGFSAVVDPTGRIVAESRFGGSPEVVHAAVRPSHETTPYQRIGDAFCWLTVATILAIGVRARRP
jgi:apolipoprotein N-acyltransferase